MVAITPPAVRSCRVSEPFGPYRAISWSRMLVRPVPAAALVYAHTGSYAGAIVGQATFLALASVLVLFARRGRPKASA